MGLPAPPPSSPPLRGAPEACSEGALGLEAVTILVTWLSTSSPVSAIIFYCPLYTPQHKISGLPRSSHWWNNDRPVRTSFENGELGLSDKVSDQIFLSQTWRIVDVHVYTVTKSERNTWWRGTANQLTHVRQNASNISQATVVCSDSGTLRRGQRGPRPQTYNTIFLLFSKPLRMFCT